MRAQPPAAGTAPLDPFSGHVTSQPGSFLVTRDPVRPDSANKTATWGSHNYDPKLDVLRVPMTVKTGADSVEQFTIQFLNMTDTAGTLEMAWEKTVAQLPFKVGT